MRSRSASSGRRARRRSPAPSAASATMTLVSVAASLVSGSANKSAAHETPEAAIGAMELVAGWSSEGSRALVVRSVTNAAQATAARITRAASTARESPARARPRLSALPRPATPSKSPLAPGVGRAERSSGGSSERGTGVASRGVGRERRSPSLRASGSRATSASARTVACPPSTTGASARSCVLGRGVCRRERRDRRHARGSVETLAARDAAKVAEALADERDPFGSQRVRPACRTSRRAASPPLSASWESRRRRHLVS